jgi:hypothetical protein
MTKATFVNFFYRSYIFVSSFIDWCCYYTQVSYTGSWEPLVFLFDSLIERDVPFIIAQVFIHPIIVCHHNFLKSFWRIFHLYSYVPLYICIMITKILFYLAYIMSLLLYCFYPVHPHMQFLLYFKLEFLKNLQYLTNDSDFWSMVITLSMAFYVLFLLNGKYIWNLMHFKLLEFSF